MPGGQRAEQVLARYGGAFLFAGFADIVAASVYWNRENPTGANIPAIVAIGLGATALSSGVHGISLSLDAQDARQAVVDISAAPVTELPGIAPDQLAS